MFITSVSVRVVAGLVLAGVIGLVGLALTGILFPATGSHQTVVIATRVCLIGGGASIGAMATWFNFSEGRTSIAAVLGMAVLGGLAGAWAGYLFAGSAQFQENLFDQVREISRITVYGGAIGANLLPLALGTLLAWRRGEIRTETVRKELT